MTFTPTFVVLVVLVVSVLSTFAVSLARAEDFARFAWTESTPDDVMSDIVSIRAAFVEALRTCSNDEGKEARYCVGRFGTEETEAKRDTEETREFADSSLDVVFTRSERRLVLFRRYVPKGTFFVRRAVAQAVAKDLRPDSVAMRGLFKRRSLRYSVVSTDDVVNEVLCARYRCGV